MGKHDRKEERNMIHPELKEELPKVALAEMPIPAPFDEKPVVKSFGIAKVKGGYCCVEIHSQGNTILETEILSGPDPKPVAVERLKISLVRKLFIGGDI